VQGIGSSGATTATPTGIASIRTALVSIVAPTAVIAQPLEWDFGDKGDQCVVLRGTSQWFGMSLLAIGSSGAFNAFIEWTEV
jgi:hypothetical protein